MRLFRRARDGEAAARRDGMADVKAPVPVSLVPAAPSSSELSAKEPSSTDALAPLGAPLASPPDPLEQSDVFLYGERSAAAGIAREVTLFVHGWHNVEPGLLSWTFPSLRAALDAVKRMKNAIAWCVVSGTGWPTLDAARASGAVLVEQLA
jgi:hypothetical protein